MLRMDSIFVRFSVLPAKLPGCITRFEGTKPVAEDTYSATTAMNRGESWFIFTFFVFNLKRFRVVFYIVLLWNDEQLYRKIAAELRNINTRAVVS